LFSKGSGGKTLQNLCNPKKINWSTLLSSKADFRHARVRAATRRCARGKTVVRKLMVDLAVDLSTLEKLTNLKNLVDLDNFSPKAQTKPVTQQSSPGDNGWQWKGGETQLSFPSKTWER